MTRREKRLVATGIALIGLALFARLWYVANGSFELFRREARQAIRLSMQAERVLAGRDQLEGELALAMQRLAVLAAGLVEGRTIDEAAASTSAVITYLAEASGGVVNRIEARASDTDSTLPGIDVEVDVEGSLDAVVRLIDAIERSDLLITISMIRLQLGPSEGVLTSDLTVSAVLDPGITP